jgi:hypothetical protein
MDNACLSCKQCLTVSRRLVYPGICREAGLASREQQVQQQAIKHGQLEQLLSALWQNLQAVPGGSQVSQQQQ